MNQAKREYRLLDVTAAPDMENERVVEGYALRYGSPATLGDYDGIKYIEVIERGALEGTDMSDVPFKYNHSNTVMIMARTRSKTLTLEPREDGLFIRASLADTTAGRDLYALIKRGDIDKMSFGFTLDYDDPDAQTRKREGSTITRIIRKITKIWDVAAVDTPAYDSTSIWARSDPGADAPDPLALDRAVRLRMLKLRTYL